MLVWLLAMWVGVAWGGRGGYEEFCSGMHPCRTEAGLGCDADTRTCRCRDPQGMTYEPSRDMCVSLLGEPCEGPECGAGAHCGSEGHCVCPPDLVPQGRRRCVSPLDLPCEESADCGQALVCLHGHCYHPQAEQNMVGGAEDEVSLIHDQVTHLLSSSISQDQRIADLETVSAVNAGHIAELDLNLASHMTGEAEKLEEVERRLAEVEGKSGRRGEGAGGKFRLVIFNLPVEAGQDATKVVTQFLEDPLEVRGVVPLSTRFLRPTPESPVPPILLSLASRPDMLKILSHKSYLKQSGVIISQ